jgi:hypothetical protein
MRLRSELASRFIVRMGGGLVASACVSILALASYANADTATQPFYVVGRPLA